MSEQVERVLIRITDKELEYALSLRDIVSISEPVPLKPQQKKQRDAIIASGGLPIQSQKLIIPAAVQGMINAHWRMLADKYGFDLSTVEQPLTCEPGTFWAAVRST